MVRIFTSSDLIASERVSRRDIDKIDHFSIVMTALLETFSQNPHSTNLLQEAENVDNTRTREVLEQAMALVKEKKPNASPQKCAAFANSIQSLVTGWSGGYGGPSVREHVACRMYGGRLHPYEKACELLLTDDGPIFGPLTELHYLCWEHEHCFDDDPHDEAELSS